MSESAKDNEAKPAKPGTKLAMDAAKPDPARAKKKAQDATAGLVSNAYTMSAYATGLYGELDIRECVEAMAETTVKVHAGSLKPAETILFSQALALNAIFNELARRSSMNIGEHLPATETYLRLALKAQGQCRATLEALAAIKNPPVVFARQANFANGPQQVNNGAAPIGAPATTRTAKTISEPNELLEDPSHGRPQLDTRATQRAGHKDLRVATVGAFDRSAHT